ncbi:hypothetical protein FNH22_11380 [Fulvivirga sp. M361]|uniref:LolA family protein n=1 Tax=Fulvivirga sp. M361 TaxID=2594266 RepID=UPI00117A4D5B|nr:hypothetical protein [Fulvivirga sp. M361]TRX59118.1 hypothetical protein FNH22_11380 [Fulvivirga sp. M361]
MNAYKYHWLLTGLLLIPYLLNAQDLRYALQQMRQMYDQMDGLHIEMSVEVSETIEATAPFYALNVDIKKEGENYLYHYGSNRMLMNDRYFIMIDESAKEMVYGKRTEVDDNSLPDYLNFNMDSILLFYDEPEYLGYENALHQYSIVQQKGPVYKIYLWIDDHTKLLRRMDYEYRQGSYVKIEFKQFNGHPSFQSDTFSEAQFIRLKDTKMVTANAYRQYHLVESVAR